MTPLDSGSSGLAADTVRNADPSAFVAADGDAGFSLCLLVENLTCAGCVQKIEKTLNALPGGVDARVSMTTKRLTIQWRDPVVIVHDFVRELDGLGFRVAPLRTESAEEDKNRQEKALLRAMAVAGFAWANIMLLSVSVWAGHVSGMEPTTRDLFHWISALIALPAVAYAGQPFFQSAARALARRHLNMDVPISLAVLLATLVSVWQAAISGPHAYFDAAVMLLFFLLVGRYLDQRNRGRTATTAQNLLALQNTSAAVLENDGKTRMVPADQLRPGMLVRLHPGDRIPADGVVQQGTSDLDISLVTGESDPVATTVNEPVYAGTLVLSGTLDVAVTKSDDETFLAEIVRLMEAAEQSKSRAVQLADRVTGFYAPAVHGAALMTFLGWWLVAGMAWDQSLLTAVAVLIITCPCALGLAVPTVQVVAAGRLFDRGILLKSGDALERLTHIDTIVFDKTGTLTVGTPVLTNENERTIDELKLAASLARSSRHPLSKALVRSAPDVSLLPEVTEHPGLGLAVTTADGDMRLGNREWCGVTADAPGRSGCSELWLRKADGESVPFFFVDQVRSDAGDVIAWAQARGYSVTLLSGDREAAVLKAAQSIGIEDWHAEQSPQDKISYIQGLQAKGHNVLMVGDGLNDAPALAAAHVSLSPSTAADVSQTAADMVFLGGMLKAIPTAIGIAHSTTSRVKENFGLALAYNVLALPIAMAGLVTPLIAALAMSSSSILVTLNALRGGKWERVT